MDFDHPPADPIAQFRAWLAEAAETDLPNPNAMALATVDADGRPSVRMMLLKGLDAEGAVFYSNRNSRKGRALAANARAALLFYWDPLGRQVRIEGRVSHVSDAESNAYFASRPRESRIGAWASQQSQPVKSRAELDAAAATIEKKYTASDIPRPPYWGGYRVSLDSIEFWQSHEFRLHDRIVYRPDGKGGWNVQRLSP